MLPLLHIEGLSKSYRNQPILRGVDLTLHAGNHHWISGPSGCGKSTLLRLIAGLEVPDTGTIRIQGTPASTAGRLLLAPHQRQLSMVFQDLGLWPNLTVRENIQLGLAGTSGSRAELAERLRAASDACDLNPLLDRRPAELSGGEQQRAALARALAPRPALLLLDEPFSGLDLVLRLNLLRHLRALAQTFGTTLCLVSHDPNDARHLNATASILEAGAIVESGPLPELLATPGSQTLRAWQSLRIGPLPSAPPDDSSEP